MTTTAPEDLEATFTAEVHVFNLNLATDDSTHACVTVPEGTPVALALAVLAHQSRTKARDWDHHFTAAPEGLHKIFFRHHK